MDDTFAILRSIRDSAYFADMHAKRISADANELVNMPGWQTKAEDVLQQAEHELRRSAHVVQQALSLIARKRTA